MAKTRLTVPQIIEAFPKYRSYNWIYGDPCSKGYVFLEITSCVKGNVKGKPKYTIEINFKGPKDDMDYQYLFADKDEALKFAQDNWNLKHRLRPY